jgi:hypothetical protein
MDVYTYEFVHMHARTHARTQAHAHTHRYTQSNIWFLRFAMDPASNFMVVGNMVGQLMLYDLAGIPSGV